MVQKTKFTATLPATRCTEKMRVDAAAVAGAAGCDIADVIRDALTATLPSMMLSLELLSLDDFDDEDLERLGLERQEEKQEPQASGGWGPDRG